MTTTLTSPTRRMHSDSHETLIRQRLRGYSNHQALMFQSVDAVSTAISDMLNQIRIASRHK
jgi:hypothetical protein